jgi:hypothetical protein
MRVPPRYSRIAKGVAAGVVGLAMPQVEVLNRMALALALAGQIRTAWIQEMKHEEEVRSRFGVDGSGGGTRGYLGAQAPLTNLIVGMLPEKARANLWSALRDRYSASGPSVYTVHHQEDENDPGVPVAPI